MNFSQEIEAAYRPVQNEVISLHARWHQWMILFATDQASVDILNQTAPFFFAEVQQVLVSDVIIGISRLFDPACMGKNENASLLWVLEAVKRDGRAVLADRLEEVLACVMPQIEVARKHRHKRIAHNDRATFLSSDRSVLPAITDTDISLLLTSAEEFLNLVTDEYGDTQTVLDYLEPSGDAAALVRNLDHAIQFRDLYFEMENAGTNGSLRW
jgi:hypothetical protein